MTPFSRRALIGRGVAGAGALAAPGSLVAAATAQAQEDDQTDALSNLVKLEQAAELAYSLSAEEGDLSPDATKAFEEFSSHAGDHATALSEALDQLLVDPPEGSDDPADYPVLDDFDAAASEKDAVAVMIQVELETIAAYEEQMVDLSEPDLARSSAQIAAAHAQQLVALRVLAEDKNLTELPPASTSATASEPDENSGS